MKEGALLEDLQGILKRVAGLSEFNIEQLASFYNEMVQSNLIELEVELPGGKIVLKRLQPNSSSNPLNFKRRRTDYLPELNQTVAPAAVPGTYKIIVSPINGVFYRSSSPQFAPFVKEGDTVSAGGTLCIVEAMKVMNEIKADARCKIVKILGENGRPVAKDQPLFHTEPL